MLDMATMGELLQGDRVPGEVGGACCHSAVTPAVVLKTLESPLDSKEIKPDYPKGNQP